MRSIASSSGAVSRRGKGRLLFERGFRGAGFRFVFLERCGFLCRKGDLLGGMGRNYSVGLFSEAYWREVSRWSARKCRRGAHKENFLSDLDVLKEDAVVENGCQILRSVFFRERILHPKFNSATCRYPDVPTRSSGSFVFLVGSFVEQIAILVAEHVAGGTKLLILITRIDQAKLNGDRILKPGEVDQFRTNTCQLR